MPLKELVTAVMAATAIHPNVPEDARAKAITGLRRRRIRVRTISRTTAGRVAVAYMTGNGEHRLGGRRRRRRRRRETVKSLQKRAGMYARLAARTLKQAATLERKLAKKAAKEESR